MRRAGSNPWSLAHDRSPPGGFRNNLCQMRSKTMRRLTDHVPARKRLWRNVVRAIRSRAAKCGLAIACVGAMFGAAQATELDEGLLACAGRDLQLVTLIEHHGDQQIDRLGAARGSVFRHDEGAQRLPRRQDFRGAAHLRHDHARARFDSTAASSSGSACPPRVDGASSPRTLTGMSDAPGMHDPRRRGGACPRRIRRRAGHLSGAADPARGRVVGGRRARRDRTAVGGQAEVRARHHHH